MSLAFKSVHLLSHECAFNGLPAWENNIDSHWFAHNFLFFFQFHLFDALFHDMEHPNGPLVMSQNFYAQMQGLEQQQMGVSFLSTKNNM